MNRVRMVLELGGRYYAGGEIPRVVQGNYLPIGTEVPPEIKGWKKIRWMVEQIPTSIRRKFWILREPRRAAYRRRRYVTFMQRVGIGRDLRKGSKFKGAIAEPVLRARLRTSEEVLRDLQYAQQTIGQRPTPSNSERNSVAPAQAPAPTHFTSWAYGNSLNRTSPPPQLFYDTLDANGRVVRVQMPRLGETAPAPGASGTSPLQPGVVEVPRERRLSDEEFDAIVDREWHENDQP